MKHKTKISKIKTINPSFKRGRAEVNPVSPQLAQTTIGRRGNSINSSFGGRYFPKLPREHLTFSRMIRLIPIVSRAMTDFQDKCSRAQWSVIPAIEEEEMLDEQGNPLPKSPEAQLAEEYAEFVREQLFDNPNFNWNDVVRRDAGYKFWGYAVSEWTLGFDRDRRLVFSDIAPRSQASINRFDVEEETGKVLGFYQGSREDNFIPIDKTVYFCDGSIDDTPEGQGVLARTRYMAEEWFDLFKTRSISIKQDARGMFVGRVPHQKLLSQGMTPDEVEAMEDNVRNIEEVLNNQTKSENMGIILPSESQTVDNQGAERIINVPEWDIQLLQGDSKGLEELEEAINSLNREMARAMYAEHILLGDNSVGSYALSEEKSKSVYQLVDECLAALVKGYSSQLIPVLFEYNGFNTELMPRLEVESADYRSLDDDIKAVNILNSFPPHHPAIDHFAAKLGIPVEPLQQRLAREAEREEREERMALGGRNNDSNSN